MDKYEYKLKLDQMKALAASGDFATAAEIADSVNWRKVKNVNLLMKAGDVYCRQKRYEEARDILLMAYDRSPIGRMIIYRLAEIAIRMKNTEEAEEYYDEFVELAPHDNLKYVLRYKISRAKGADIHALIAILEELKEAEYTEEWAYQLAYLYHKAGESEKCIDACDELILWFGEGIYVERALELKMLYRPLTKAQEDKYRAFRRRRGIATEAPRPEGEAVRIPVVQENVGKFNTANLQEELAKSMQQIMEATEKETVDDTMDNIKKMVEDIPYLKVAYREEKADAGEAGRFETDQEIDENLRDNFKEILAEDRDGQYSILVDETDQESQIDGQMSIEDVLSNWEKTRRAVKAALSMAQRQKLESAKARALQEAGDIMERLAEVMPKLDAGISPTQLLKEEYLSGEDISNEERASKLMEGMNNMLQQQIDKLQEEAGDSDGDEGDDESDLLKKVRQAKPNFDEQIGLKPYIPTQFDPDAFEDAQDLAKIEIKISQEPENIEKEPAAQEEEIARELAAGEPGTGAQEPGMPEAVEIPTEEMRLAEAEFYRISPEELDQRRQDADDLQIEAQGQAPADVQKEQDPSGQGSVFLKQATKKIKVKQVEEALKDKPAAKSDHARRMPAARTDGKRKAKKTGDAPAIRKLSEEQKAIFSYFVPVAGMEKQICKVLSDTVLRFKKGTSPSSGHILIQGGNGCGKTVLATAMVKALQKELKRPNARIGKIDAKILNKKDLAKLIQKIQGGFLVIERAGDLAKETAVRLSLLLEQETSGLMVIMEDTRKGLAAALGQDEGLAKKFTEKITIPIFTSDELVEFGKAYAHDLDYEIDEMGVLALYNRISNIQRLDRATTLTEVKEIVDEAIEKADKKSIKKAFSIITSRRYTNDDYVLLREKDFEE